MGLPKSLKTGVTAKLPGVPGDWKKQGEPLRCSFKIVLPLPPRELSPNWRGHWAQKARKAAKYRADAGTACKAMMRRYGIPTLAAANVQARFYFRDRRNRDRDNLLASLKSGFDGLADVGMVANDSQLTYLPVALDVDKDDARVELWISTD